MTAINTTLLAAYTTSQKSNSAVQPALSSAFGSSSVSGASGNFGSAYTLSVSAVPASSGNGSSSAGASAAASGGGGVPVTSSSASSSETQELIQEAVNRAAVQIGYGQASNVVDAQGNIEYQALRSVENQQSAVTAARQQLLNPPANTTTQAVDIVA